MNTIRDIQPRHQLLKELRDRQARNPRFSLRAFARHLSVSPGHLSAVISGKKPMTVRLAKAIAAKLGLSPIESRLLAPLGEREANLPLSERRILKEEEFQLIADLRHYAILGLAALKNHRATPKWISQKLNISRLDAADALERLVRMGILEIAKGKMRQISPPLWTADEVPSAAVRRHHQQVLSTATQALDAVPVEKREFSSLTIAIDPETLPEAKREIRRFRDAIARLLTSENATEVYTFSMQLFPITHTSHSKKGRKP